MKIFSDIVRLTKSNKHLWIFAGVFVLMTLQPLLAQKKSRKHDLPKTDTLDIFRTFISVSNGYKQTPLYLNLDISNKTNFISSREDTATIHARFYIGGANSYVRLGEFEQLVNDSVALLVSDRLRQMILYTNAAPVISQMRTMLNAAIPDSSVLNLSKKFTASSREIVPGTNAIELKSRELLYGNDLQKETITLQYAIGKNEPEQVKMVRLSLIRIDSVQYGQLSRQPGMVAKLQKTGNSYFLIKEQTTAYNYKNIEKVLPGGEVPVTIKDRVAMNTKGEYLPVKKYENYRLNNDN